MKISSRIIIFFFLFLASSLYAQDDLPEPMSPPRLVNDFARIFDASQREDLETMLRNYHDSTSTQIYVVTVPSLNGYAPSDFATQLGEKWGVGQKGKDNGIIILIKPRIGNESGQIYIATGYGVEHVLNDARVGRIIDEKMIPYLPDNYYMATKSAIETIISYLSGEFKNDEIKGVGIFLASNLFVFIAIFVIIFILIKINKGGGGGGYYGGGSSSHDSTGSFDGSGSSWGGSFGGRSSGGGSFGGGGSGSFGGGGAGRSF